MPAIVIVDGIEVDCQTLENAYARIAGARRNGQSAHLKGMHDIASQEEVDASNDCSPISQEEIDANR